jgi:hypothetical protein
MVESGRGCGSTQASVRMGGCVGAGLVYGFPPFICHTACELPHPVWADDRGRSASFFSEQCDDCLPMSRCLPPAAHLSAYLQACLLLPVCLPAYKPACLPAYLPACPSDLPHAGRLPCLPACLPICPSAGLPILPTHTS